MIRMETPHVVGLLEKSGDPSPVTRLVFTGHAPAHSVWGEESLQAGPLLCKAWVMSVRI